MTSRQGGWLRSGPGIALVASLTLLYACAPSPQPVPPTTEPASPPRFPWGLYERDLQSQGHVYRVVTKESEALLKVYRGGRLARLGHNHVISARHLEGYVFVGDGRVGSRADLFVPLHRLVVDAPADRAAAGEEFASELSADAIGGTRDNMLGNRGLEAERFPFIEIAAAVNDGGPPQVQLALTITLHGVTRRISVPTRLEIDDDELRVEGEFEIAQSTFGITPFSALGGALLVQDTVQVSYSVLARRLP